MSDPAPNLPGYVLTSDVLDATRHRVLAYTSVDAAQLPPPPPPPPLVPAIAWKVAGAGTTRGDGFSFMNTPGKPVNVQNQGLKGFEQNLVCQNVAGVNLTNVVSVAPHRASATDRFKGQCLYLTHAGPVTVSGYAGLWAGWQPGMDPRTRIGFFHGTYSNWGNGDVLIEDFVYYGCAHCGGQFRAIGEDPDQQKIVRGKATKRNVTLRRGVIIDCGIGVMAVAGNVALDDVVIYKGHRWFERKTDGTPSWPGDIAISAYTDTALNNVLILGAPGQDQPSYGEPANEKRYDLGAVVGSRSYGPHPEVSTGARWTIGADCRIRGWPGPAFSGDAPCPSNGWTVGGSPVAVNVDPLLAELTAGARPVKDIRADLSKLIRDAAA